MSNARSQAAPSPPTPMSSTSSSRTSGPTVKTGGHTRQSSQAHLQRQGDRSRRRRNNTRPAQSSGGQRVSIASPATQLQALVHPASSGPPRREVHAQTWDSRLSGKLLEYAVGAGWADPIVLKPIDEIQAKPSDPRRDWLHPEHTAILDPLMHGREFEADETMRWETMLATGVRVEDLVGLQPCCLKAADGVLIINGKGKKVRRVPVSTEFQATWLDYVASRRLKPNDWMFPVMGYRFQSGGGTERVVLDPRKHCDPKAVRAMLERLQELATERAVAGDFDAALLPSFKLVPRRPTPDVRVLEPDPRPRSPRPGARPRPAQPPDSDGPRVA